MDYKKIKNPQIISALIGLAGAIQTNPKTEHTDQIIKMALLSEDTDIMINKIHEEKFAISPNCATCQYPCGNTSDYDMEQFEQTSEEIVVLKYEIIHELYRLAAKTEGDLPQIIFRGISFLGYDLEEEPYRRLLQQMKDVNGK